MLEQLISSAKENHEIPRSAADSYTAHAKDLVEFVNQAMFGRQDLPRLIGTSANNSLMMRNHKNHTEFMGTVFSLNDFELLARTLPWVYRTYTNKKFSLDYFLHALRAWQDGCREILGPEASREILGVYRWMEESHRQVARLAESAADPPVESSRNGEVQERLLDLLLRGESQGSYNLCRSAVKDFAALRKVYTEILTPVLYRVGALWEKGEISIAQEHMASAQIVQIMALLYHEFVSPEESRGVLVVATAPEELHEIPAWMVANSLEGDGWDVRFVGCDTPEEELVRFLKETAPMGLALSLTMSYHFNALKELIDHIRRDEELADLPIMVGGYALNQNPELVKYLNRVCYTVSLEQTVEVARDWKT